MAYKQQQKHNSNKLSLKCLAKNSKNLDTQINYQEMEKQALENPTSCAQKLSFVPTFNHDKLYFTPAFVTPIDLKYYRLNETFELYQFQDKIQHQLFSLRDGKSTERQQNIQLASPPSNYCQICSINYQNYFSHIADPTHIKTIDSNSINSTIQQLCWSFNQKQISKPIKPKQKPIRKRQRPTNQKDSFSQQKQETKLKTEANKSQTKTTSGQSISDYYFSLKI